MASTFANTGFAQMSGSGQPKAGSMSGRSASSAVASTNMMGATNTPGGGMGGTNLLGGTNRIMPGMGGTIGGTNWTFVGGTNGNNIFQPNQQPSGMGMSGPTGARMSMPADLQQMMKQFQSDRDAFITKQKAIETQLKGASEQQRQTLMMQMQGQMQQWKEQHAMIRQQMFDQVQQMKQQMMEQQRLMNQAVTPGPGSPQGGGKPGRPMGTGGH